MKTHETSEAQSLSHRITQWAKGNDWYHTEIQTNQLRLEQTFGQSIEAIAKDLDYQNQPTLRRHLLDRWYLLMAKCCKTDILCRSGCRNEDEILDLEFLRIEAVGTAAEMDCLIQTIQKLGQCKLSIPWGQVAECKMPAKSPKEPATDPWISFAHAAEIMGVTKGTISKWANEGKLRDNGLKRKKRNLLKTSVLLLKQDMEDKAIRKDLKEFREDSRKLKIVG